MKNNKRGAITVQAIPGLVLALTLSIIFLGAGALLAQEFIDEQTASNDTTSTYYITNKSMGGFTKVADFMPLIGLMIAIAVIIGIIITAVAGGGGGGSLSFR